MRPVSSNSKTNDKKNQDLRKSFILRRSLAPNNVLDRTHKFKIEDLFDFPQSPPSVKTLPRRQSKLMNTSEDKAVPLHNIRKSTRKCSEIFTINPNLNSNFTMNTFSLSNFRLRKYTFKPKEPNIKLKVVIGINKFY